MTALAAPDAVEAAARADWERYPMRKAWADISPEARENARAYIRPILTAAAPLIAQQALLDAASPEQVAAAKRLTPLMTEDGDWLVDPDSAQFAADIATLLRAVGVEPVRHTY